MDVMQKNMDYSDVKVKKNCQLASPSSSSFIVRFDITDFAGRLELQNTISALDFFPAACILINCKFHSLSQLCLHLRLHTVVVYTVKASCP